MIADMHDCGTRSQFRLQLTRKEHELIEVGEPLRHEIARELEVPVERVNEIMRIALGLPLPRIALVANGDADLSAIPEDLRPYRYLLSADAATRLTPSGLAADP